MNEKSYIDHTFPVILHSAMPARLDPVLRKNLDIFLPRAKTLLENIIVSKGKSKRDFRFFRACHMAIVLTPEAVIFCLDTHNATLFLTALYCFELDVYVSNEILDDILCNQLDMCDAYFFDVPRRFIESPDTIDNETLLQVINEWYSYEEEMIEDAGNIITFSPKVFKNTNIRVKPDYCFVLMPFSADLKEVYEDCILAATKETGMECKRADDIFHNASIMDVVWTEICSAEIVVADLTGKNPNVFYELGIAHTLGKETIMITQNSEDVPFDLRHLRFIKYSNTGRGLVELKKQLILSIQSTRSNGEEITRHN